jgi:hypothetical protein
LHQGCFGELSLKPTWAAVMVFALRRRCAGRRVLRMTAMLWLKHFFALWILAHMLWATVLLEREARRIRSVDGPVPGRPTKDGSRAVAAAEASQASTGL